MCLRGEGKSWLDVRPVLAHFCYAKLCHVLAREIANSFLLLFQILICIFGTVDLLYVYLLLGQFIGSE